ncbi:MULTISPECIES: PilZ domain-containing protein [unclassified Bradyrhizobium]|uniref:PilZ domain-containing protein n=1 Tax=unclassified Bradyrhizobium TaxID=2631580 RepID=UPI0028EE3263|nr:MULTISPECIES: PilZ domain-containing protein [unclassified Bradyrhizobium]
MSVARFLKQRAVRIQTVGTYTLPNWYDPQGRLRSFACRTTRVSPFRALLDVPVVGKVGDRLTSYFRDFGKFEGEISDTVHGGFLLELEMTRAERAKLAEKLVWLEKKQKDPTLRDSRRDARFVPNSPHSELTLADGSCIPCLVIDASMSGAAVSAAVQPEIGTPLAVGSCIGRVVRHFPDGFAVRFVDTIPASSELERRVITPPTRPTRQKLASHHDDERGVETPQDFFMV